MAFKGQYREETVMATRGQYAKGVAKRAEILAAALEIIAERGYSKTTLKELADAVGLSQNGVLHYFGSKENLLAEVLRRRDAVDREAMESSEANGDMMESLPAVVARNASVPGLVALFSRLSAEASEADHPAHEFFAERYEEYARLVAGGVRQLQAEGGAPADLDPERFALLLGAVYDGLQTRWLYDQSIDMADLVRYFLHMAGFGGSGAGATNSEDDEGGAARSAGAN